MTQIFAIEAKNGEIVAGAKVSLLDEETKSRLGLDQGSRASLKGALSEYVATKVEYRNLGLFLLLTDKEVEWAKQRNVDYLVAELETTNPISTWTHIREGMTLVGIREAGAGIPNPYFVAVKDLKTSKVNGSGDKNPEWKEIEVGADSCRELKKLFADGWMGVDIKGVDENVTDLSTPWTTVLEK